MAREIRLVWVLLLVLGASASPYAKIEEKYVRELEENIKRVPALLSGNEAAPKINVEPFSELSKAVAQLNIENIKSPFDYTEYDGVNNVTEFSKYIWVRYDYITESLKIANRNDANDMKALIEDAKKRGVLTKITEEVLQNNHLQFARYYDDTFKTYAATNIPVCTKHRSRQQVIHDFYKLIVLTDLMSAVIRALFVEIGEIPRTSETEFQKFFSRQKISSDNIKSAMASASRSLYACDPAENRSDKASTSLDLFDVGLYLSASPYSCEGEEALTPCCKYQYIKKRCASESWTVINTTGKLTFCDAPKFKLPFVSTLPINGRFQSTSSDEVSRICADEPQGKHSCVSESFTCISKDNKTDRYFHLGEVFSDSGPENKVITGVRLVKEGNFFYIRIQQGKLGPHDSIVPNTTEWKKVENKISDVDSYAKTHPKYKFPETSGDFHVIHDNVLAVNLDDVNPPKNPKKRYALTGIKFTQEDGALKLAVETKPYNYETGVLRGRNEWRSNEVPFKSRKELVLEDPVEPIYYNRQYEISKPGTFVKFQGTTLKNSLEEIKTVPFIDLQEVVTNPPSPVSGAGIFVRGAKGSGGYLSLKLITQDYASDF